MDNNELFLEWRDKFDAFLLTKKGTIRIKRWDKLYDEYCEALSNSNRDYLESLYMANEADYVPDPVDPEDDEDTEPMTFEEDMNSSLDAFDESTMKHQVFTYSYEDKFPKRDDAHPWPKDSNDLSTLMAIYVSEADIENEDTLEEFQKIFKPGK